MFCKIIAFLVWSTLFWGNTGWAGEITLPEVMGWKASPANFLQYHGASGKAFHFSRTYSKAGASVQLFFAGGPEGEKFQRLLAHRLEVATKDYYLKYFQERSFRCLLSYSRLDKKGFMAVFLNDKPVVILLACYQGLTDAEIKKWLKRFDWATLKQKALAFLED